MNKLIELEKRLKEAREELIKLMPADSPMPGSVNTTGGPSIASQIGFGKAEKKELVGDQKKLDMDKDGDIEADDLAALREKKKKMKKAEHPDEKEDKKLIAEALDRHNEKKHGEAKDEDSAKKDMKLKKSEKLSSLSNGQWVLEKTFSAAMIAGQGGAKSQKTAEKMREEKTKADNTKGRDQQIKLNPNLQVRDGESFGDFHKRNHEHWLNSDSSLTPEKSRNRAMQFWIHQGQDPE